MATLSWYWHRLRAMSATEMALHARKKARQWRDSRATHDWASVDVRETGNYPNLPPSGEAPAALREALVNDVDAILAGRWRAFGHLPIQVDDPPRWQKDYLANVDLHTSESAFRLDHRKLPDGADIKLIWELSRWYQLTRLAMAAYVLEDERAARKCIEWLEDWVTKNPPFFGWNWTSALESGMRLIQFTWIDALLAKGAEAWGLRERLQRLRHEILPAHLWFTWRYRSFGSSANNHLLGELVGALLATARWPGLAALGPSLSTLQSLYEEQTLAQFASDGGNREQALNYQLFSLEFCLHARAAVLASGNTVSQNVEDRLDHAMRFFWDVQSHHEQWDYGDSDNAFVLPLFARDATVVAEWRNWIASRNSPALDFWLDAPPVRGRGVNSGAPAYARQVGPWWHFSESGIAVCESGLWWLRWDMSPLGYLSTAAHGHLDALHLSVWFDGVPLVIDPGTGAYYADKNLRNWLASRAAHNAPCPPDPEWPRRLGPFLWEQHHQVPRSEFAGGSFNATLAIEGRELMRRITFHPGEMGFDVQDSYRTESGNGEFAVRWQFAPATSVKQISSRSFQIRRKDKSISINVSDDWSEVHLVEQRIASSSMEGTVSPAFRKVDWAPYLKLIARPKPGESCVFRTTFVASAAS